MVESIGEHARLVGPDRSLRPVGHPMTGQDTGRMSVTR
jgi:hypothetical protein